MGSVNVPNPAIDPTVKIFDAFYAYEQNVSAMEWDAVVSFFETTFTTKEAAENFSVALFRVSNESNIPVLTLLQELQNKDTIQLNLTLAYYLNSIRSPSTLLGVAQPTTPNYYAARNIQQ
jgi:hypothetical protein